MDNQNGTTDLLEEFAASIEQLAHTIEGIARLEEEKAETASLGYHDRMDGILKREQVYILKLRGLEQKRLRLAEAMAGKGLPSARFSVSPPQNRPAASPPCSPGWTARLSIFVR